MKIHLVNEDGHLFMGSGLLDLLHEVEREESIYKAAEQLGLSYVKALKIINRLEDNLQEKVVERRRGGNDRGGAELTDFGRRFVAAYKDYCDRMSKHSKAEFKQFESALKGKAR